MTCISFKKIKGWFEVVTLKKDCESNSEVNFFHSIVYILTSKLYFSFFITYLLEYSVYK